MVEQAFIRIRRVCGSKIYVPFVINKMKFGCPNIGTKDTSIAPFSRLLQE
ncbi:hypothetical protein GCM10008014_15600 [Paenibacillus silvae]|uniref:Uncharacterized protein n=1 Tax=Paenibacillus silvae TaxID=1325358 RepID=A0ABQ1Z5I1_9BACL|nr:hypothetical protein GCM10008014_15600 [Paenibacillus silvae]